MALRTPVVATDAGGTREVARPDIDALIVPPGDAAALVRAIAAVLADPSEAARRADAARARVEHELSFAERTRRLEGIYDALMAEHGRQQPVPARADTVGVSGA